MRTVNYACSRCRRRGPVPWEAGFAICPCGHRRRHSGPPGVSSAAGGASRLAAIATPPADSDMESAWLASLPCSHRGQRVGAVECSPCLGSRRVALYACALHGQCHVRALPTKHARESGNCNACPDREKPESTEGAR